MAGTVINCTSIDSVRIEVLGEGRSITLPASLILAFDRVLRYELLANAELRLHTYSIGEIREWEAYIAAGRSTLPSGHAHAATPWAAIEALAKRLDENEGVKGNPTSESSSPPSSPP